MLLNLTIMLVVIASCINTSERNIHVNLSLKPGLLNCPGGGGEYIAEFTRPSELFLQKARALRSICGRMKPSDIIPA